MASHCDKVSKRAFVHESRVETQLGLIQAGADLSEFQRNLSKAEGATRELNDRLDILIKNGGVEIFIDKLTTSVELLSTRRNSNLIQNANHCVSDVERCLKLLYDIVLKNRDQLALHEEERESHKKEIEFYSNENGRLISEIDSLEKQYGGQDCFSSSTQMIITEMNATIGSLKRDIELLLENSDPGVSREDETTPAAENTDESESEDDDSPTHRPKRIPDSPFPLAFILGLCVLAGAFVRIFFFFPGTSEGGNHHQIEF